MGEHSLLLRGSLKTTMGSNLLSVVQPDSAVDGVWYFTSLGITVFFGLMLLKWAKTN